MRNQLTRYNVTLPHDAATDFWLLVRDVVQCARIRLGANGQSHVSYVHTRKLH